jgi:hypothetical protein
VFAAAQEQRRDDGESRHAEQGSLYQRIAPFLATGKDVAARVLQGMGFKGRHGKNEDGIATPLAATSHPLGTAGIDFAGGATGSEVSEASAPDPDLDPEAWARLVVSNSRQNSGESTIAQLRRDWSDETGDEMALRWCRNQADVIFADEVRAWATRRLERRTLDLHAVGENGTAAWQPQEQQAQQQQPNGWFGVQR